MGLRKVLITFVAIIFALNSWASHIMGGDISYSYMGQQASGAYRYEITFTIFGNCDQNSNWPNPMNDIMFGIYMEGTDPTADKLFIEENIVNLTSTSFFTPDLPAGCTMSTDVCAWEAKYVQVVDLPTSVSGNFANGYHIYYDVCCRNGSIINLDNPGFTGSAFYAFIPNPLLVNSSPIFANTPLPFICVNDTTPLLNTAFDPDGDLLVFSFEEPYRGYSSGGGAPGPTPTYSVDINPLVWPIPQVTWASGYTAAQPFGASGYSSINGFTGASEYMSTLQGPFVVAVEIKEYRNGNLIGITRRDMQFQVVQCQVNPNPVLTNSGPVGDTLGSGTTNYVIEEGDTLCFDILFDDSNNDDITLSSNGIIFDAAQTTPEATINTPQIGTGSAEATFCWETGCDQGRPQPYLFTVNATDDGCLPQTGAEAYAILISEFTGPTSINGPVNVCSGSLGVNYSVLNITDATYSWSVNGGTVASGQGTNSINIDWSQGVLGEVSVTTTSANGCPVAPINLLINIIDINIDAGRDTSICIGDTVAIGGNPTAPGGYTLAWGPSNEIDNGGTYNPNAYPSTDTQFILTVTDGAGCYTYDTVDVTVFVIPVTTTIDTNICERDTAQLTASGGTTYLWSPNSDIDDINISNPSVFPITVTEYFVTVSDANGCQNTDSVLVSVNTLPTGNAGTDVWICPGDSAQLLAAGGTSYLWNPVTGLNSSIISNPMSNPGIDTEYIVTITDGNNCSIQDSVWVYSADFVPTEAGNDTTICPEDSVMLGGNPTAPIGSTYLWLPSTGLSSDVVANPMALVTAPTWYYVYTTNDTCTGVDSVFIDLHVSPIIDAGVNVQICIGSTTQLNATGGVSYSWTPNDSLNDDSISDPLAYPTDTTKYYVVGEDVNTCSAQDSVTVIVNPLPLAYAGPDIQICVGDTAELIATGGDLYNWSGVDIINTSNDSALAFPSDTMDYVVEVTDSNACVLTDTMTVVFNPLPFVDAGLNREICIFDTTLLVAVGGLSYSWTPTDSLSNSNTDSTFAWPTDTTKYIVQVTDTNGCINVDSVVITVNPLPDVDAGLSHQICVGDTTELIATGGDLYSWLPADSLSNPNSSSTYAWPTDTTKYIVQVTDTNGCINVDSVEITVNPLPNVNAGLDVQICIFDSTELIATGGDIYSWTPTDSIATPSNDSTLSWPIDTTLYTVQVTDSNACVNWDSVTVIVNPLPLVDAGPDLWLCPTDTIEMIATGGDIYTWLITDSLGSPNNDTTLIWPMDTLDYIVEVIDTNGCIFWDTTNVVVNPVVPTDAGPDTSICFLDSIMIGGSPTSPIGTIYSWNTLLGMVDSTYANPTVSPADTFQYIVETVNSICNGTDTVQVIVIPLPVVDAGLDVQVCLFGTTELIATGGEVYTWLPLDSLSNPDSSATFANPTDTTEYFVLVTDSNSCMNTDSVTIIVNPFPLVDAGPSVQICIDDTALLIATGGDIYVWSPADSLLTPNNDSTLAYPTDTTQYSVFVTDSNGCVNIDSVIVTVNPYPIVDAGLNREICIGDITELIATGGDLYSWSPLDSVQSPTNDTTNAWPTDTTLYFIQVTDSNGCISIDSVEITVNPLPDISAGLDVQICTGDTTQIIATGGNTYIWTPATNLASPNNDTTNVWPADTTDYMITSIDSNACTNTDVVAVIVNPLPIVDAGIDTTSCNNTPVILGGSPTGPALSDYAWSPNFEIDDSTFANPTVSPTQTNTYLVEVTDSNSCVDFDTVTVNIFAIEAIEDTSMCQFTDLILFVNTFSGVAPYIYNWAPNSDLTTTSYDTTTASPTEPISYYVSVTDGHGCLERDTVNVDVYDAPMAIFDYTLLPSCEGLIVDFINQSTQADSYLWEFQDGETSTETEPSTLFTYNEDLVIRLIAMNNSGCSDTTDYAEPVKEFTQYVDLNPASVFTPNGDGINDVFRIEGNFNLTGCVNLLIYNRWGTLVFSSSDNYATWDGRTFAGEEVPGGVYFYVLEINGMIFKKSVTLSR